jgi:hypothetical protein
MFRKLMRVGAISLFTLPAHAQGMGGATLGLQYDYNADRHLSQTTLGGSFGFGLGGLSLQGDLGKRFSSGGPDALSLGAHVVGKVGAASAVGGFLTYDDLANSGDDVKMGVEGKFAVTDAFSVEGYLMRVNRSGGRSDFGAVGLDATFGLSGGSSLSAGLFNASGDTDLTRYSVGIGYAVSPAFTVKLDAARVVSASDRDSVFGLSLDYAIGGGATFGQRDYPHLLPGF